MDHGHMDHGHMDHGDMGGGHGGHGGMDMGDGPKCNMNMLFTWDTTDLCIVFRSWHVGSTWSLIVSLFGVVVLCAGYELVREVSRRYEASVAARQGGVKIGGSGVPGKLALTISCPRSRLAFARSPSLPLPPYQARVLCFPFEEKHRAYDTGSVSPQPRPPLPLRLRRQCHPHPRRRIELTPRNNSRQQRARRRRLVRQGGEARQGHPRRAVRRPGILLVLHHALIHDLQRLDHARRCRRRLRRLPRLWTGQRYQDGSLPLTHIGGDPGV